jgi:methyl-accepting chemotaxis protein
MIQADPDELDRAASALRKTRDQLLTTARSIRSAAGQMPHFRGQAADRCRQELERLARSTQQQADEVGGQADSLRRLAQDLRAVRMR